MSYSDTEMRYNIEINGADRENYWRYYGLKHDPFAVALEGENYLSPRWEQYIDLLHYLCHSKNVILMVTGAKRAGKTIFLRFFLEHFYKEPVHICHLAASPSLNSANLVAALAKDFALPESSGESIEDKLEEHLTRLQQTSELCLLVIDNAHRLPQETIQKLLFLIKHQSESQMRLHILLVGETHLQEALMLTAHEEGVSELLHNITLEPFTIDETTAYLTYRMDAAGLPAALPFSKSTIARIQSLSEGIPGRINVVARQSLIDAMRQRQLYSFFDYIRSRRVKFAGGLVFLALFVVIFYFLVHNNHFILSKPQNIFLTKWETREEPKIVVSAVKPVVKPATNMISATAPMMPAKIITSAPAVVTKPMVAPAMPPVVKTIAPIAHVPLPKPVSKPVAPVQQQIQVNHNNINTQATKPAASKPIANVQQSPATLSAPPAAKVEAVPLSPVVPKAEAAAENAVTANSPIQITYTPVKASAPLTATVTGNKIIISHEENANPAPVQNEPVQNQPVPVQSEIVAKTPVTAKHPPKPVAGVGARSSSLNELLANSPSSYTLQLIGVSSEASLQKFIAANGLKGRVAYYHTNHQGRDWYVLLYDNYPNAKAAVAAVRNLSGDVQGLHPFPRTIASVKESVNK